MDLQSGGQHVIVGDGFGANLAVLPTVGGKTLQVLRTFRYAALDMTVKLKKKTFFVGKISI